MSRAFLAILAAIALAFISVVGGCSEGQSGGSGENPSTIAASLTYQGIPAKDRWIDICYGSGFSQEELLCTTSYVTNAGLTDEQGQTTLESVPPGPGELCVSTDYILPVRICEQPPGLPLDPNLRCQSDADCQGVPTQCVCRFDKPDCGINLNGAACSTDAECTATNPDSVCSGICGGKKKNNYFFQTVGFCTSTWEGTCSTQSCSIGTCGDETEAPCTITQGCGEGIECLFDECTVDSDCDEPGAFCGPPRTCANDFECAVGATCLLPPDLQKFCSSTGEICRSQEECPLGDSCAVPATVCSVSGADCSANEPCSGRNCSVDTVSCLTDGECAGLRNVCSISATTCIDDSECPSGETCEPQTCETETCVNRLPGTPCYSKTGGLAETGGCPTYCLTNPDQLCTTAADCGLVCRYSLDPCETDDNCAAKACTLTQTACTGQGVGQCSAQNLCSETGEICVQNEDCPFKECSGTGDPCFVAADCADQGKFCSNTGRACEETTDCTGDGECEAQTCDPTQTCDRDLCRRNRCIVNPAETCDQLESEECLRLNETTSLCADPLPAAIELRN